MSSGLWLVAGALAAAAPSSELTFTPPPPAVAAITLGSQKAAVDRSSGAPVLRVTAAVRSTLVVPVDSITVAVVWSEGAEAVRVADLSQLYARGPRAGEQLGIVVRRAAVTVPARGDAPLELVVPIDPAAPAPRAFFADVVSYGLRDFDAKLLLDLLATAAPADEAAAVEALALSGTLEERRAARTRFGAKEELVAGLAGELDKSIPERPTEAETFRRVYAARALGVLGGSTAQQALTRLGADPRVNRLDEPLQVLRIARLAGSAIEAPLAFAVPAEAQNMSEVVRLALADLTQLAETPFAVPPSSSAAASADASAAAKTASDDVIATRADVAPLPAVNVSADESSAPTRVIVVLALVLFFVVTATLGYLLGRRGGRRRDGGARGRGMATGASTEHGVGGKSDASKNNSGNSSRNNSGNSSST